MALDYNGKEGIATSIGHAPISGLINPTSGSRNAITESLTNIIWAPLKDGLKSVSLSANWMWPCKNEGEDARLYEAVKAISEFAIDLGINVPTGKDSLSMKQKYADDEVISPGTVIISAVGNCNEISKVVEPLLQVDGGNIYYINISQDTYKLGGSSFNQVLNTIGNETPNVENPAFVKTVFNTIQDLIKDEKIIAGHDVASGGLITTLLELCFADVNLGADIDLSSLSEIDSIKLLFSENSGIVFQADTSVETILSEHTIEFFTIGKANNSGTINIKNNEDNFSFDVVKTRDTWYRTSFLLDQKQTANDLAKDRYDNYKNQPLHYKFPKHFTGKIADMLSGRAQSRPLDNLSTELISSAVERHEEIRVKPKAAIIREKGSNSEREMANAMYLAGFDVKDVHMTDLISGRETLEDIQFIGAVGGFSNSDVLGSAKGWAGAFKYNEKANIALKNFFDRNDTLSVGICNGAQLWMELDLMNPDHEVHGKLVHNDSKKHESSFTSVKIQKNNSVMLSTLAGTELGVWISHGEGKFDLPYAEDKYDIVAKYSYEGYPNNPNGSDFNTAMMCDKTGRHLATMPHIERSTFQWNWANYPQGRKDEVSPWLEAFVNARNWIENKK
jgi:phosphoribosylformylglycinamidine synthase